MKSTIATAGLFCLLSQALSAQLTPFQKEGKWGYKNQKQEIIVQPKYDFAEPFANGMAKVGMQGNKVWWDGWLQRDTYGYIDEKGAEFIPLIYTELSAATEGLIKARKTAVDSEGNYTFDSNNDGKRDGEHYGYINTSNEVIIPFKYRYLGDLFEDDPSGQIIFGGTDYYHWAVINRKGEELIPPTLSEKPKNTQKNNAFFYIQRDRKRGLIDGNGRIILEPVYESVSASTVGSDIWVTQNKKRGIIDWNGKTKVPVIYDKVSRGSSKGFFEVELNGKKYLFKEYSEAPLTDAFETMKRVELNWYEIESNGKKGLMNASGTVVFQPEFTSIKLYKDGKVRTEQNERFGISDTLGNVSIKPEYETLYRSEFGYSFATNKSALYYPVDLPAESMPVDFAVIDDNGKALIRGGKYDDFRQFNADFVWAQRKGKWMLVSLEKGKPALKTRFDKLQLSAEQKAQRDAFDNILDMSQEELMVGQFVETVMVVEQDSLLGAVNQEGSLILACEYDEIEGEFGMVRVRKDDLWGVFDDDGKMIVPLKYELIDAFRKPYRGEGKIEAKFWNPGGETGGYLDLQGQERVW